jgi:archaellum component FlaC
MDNRITNISRQVQRVDSSMNGIQNQISNVQLQMEKVEMKVSDDYAKLS